MLEGKHVGRNDPCPCGSGKKYKRCCLPQAQSVDLVWHRLRRAEGHTVNAVLEYVAQHFGTSAVDQAWADFTGWDEDIGPASAFEGAFIPWFVFNWIPNPQEAEANGVTLPQQPLVLHYLGEHPTAFDDFEQRFIRATCARPLSFYAITAVERDRSLTLKDIMTQREVTVLERLGTQHAERGHIFFARAVELDGVAIMCGYGPLLIPPRYHTQLIDVREQLARKRGILTDDLLHEYDLELRRAYFDIDDEIHHPQLPKICNTDGDPLVPTELRFELHCTPGEAFNVLKSLSFGAADDDLDDASHADDGSLRSVRFDWHKAGNRSHKSRDNTVLGSIHIDGTALTVNVNSEQRARRIRKEIETRLGAQATFKAAVVESIEKALEEKRGRAPTAAERQAREEHDRLAQIPEVQESLKHMIEQYYQDWLDERIPALGNQTPRQAARTAAGRERLEALLQEFEWSGGRSPDLLLKPDVAKLRNQLGL